jgi:hypothetical protein
MILLPTLLRKIDRNQPDCSGQLSFVWRVALVMYRHHASVMLTGQ